MRPRTVFIIVACIALAALCSASQNPTGIADRYMISFGEQVRVADHLLPAGSYQIRHVMEGQEHIMVFRQVGVRNPVEVRAKCNLVTLASKAEQSQKIFEVNGANERVLKELTFKGDLAKHVF
ncbi:MAG TPA: hypothetical protein VMI10_11070 [Terriglobales bacterium]|nr:hypothetical protein [Terriglobales bacterium]